MRTTKDTKGPVSEITAHGVTVRFYRGVKRTGGKSYPFVRIAYHEPGHGRRMRDFATEEDAVAEARSIAAKIGSGRHDAITLTRDEVSEFNLCRSKLEGTGCSLFQAVELLLEHRSKTQIDPKDVSAVVAEYLTELEHPDRGLSVAYVAHERQVGRKFAVSFKCPLSSVTTEIFKSWIGGLKLRSGGAMSPRYKINIQRSFAALVSFAASRNYVTREHAAQVSEMKAPRAEDPKRDVFTAEEFRKLLEASDDRTRPAIILCGFCGLRTAEVGRILWSDVKLAQRVVVVGAHAAKTQSRRVIPLCDAAVEWLAPFANQTGPVLPVDDRHIAAVGVAAGVSWRKNGLRHSYASFRLAILKNHEEAAFELGNSPAMIQKHYRALVTPEEAAAWFSIRPSTEANVIPMPATA